MASNTDQMVVGFEGFVRIRGTRVEVSKWYFDEKYIQADVTHSGCKGQVARKRVATDWTGGFEAPYFKNIGILTLLRKGLEIETWFVMSDGEYSKGLAVVETFKVVSDSTGTDVVRYSVTLSGAGPSSSDVITGDDPMVYVASGGL